MIRYFRSAGCAAALAAALALALAPALPAAGYATRSSSGAVSFRATPKGVVDGQFRIDLVVDTHSGSLAAVDLRKQARLRVGAQDYPPVAPVPLSGHHGTGSLLFALSPAPAAFELVISASPAGSEVRFTWP
jgi:hypothetical protein